MQRGDEVLLVVVEVGRQVARVGLLGGRLVRAEVDTVVLAALHQDHALQRRRDRLDHADRVDHERKVALHVFRLHAAGEAGVEDVGDVGEAGELLLGLRVVQQVDGDEGGSGLEVRGPPRQPDDLPPAFGLECLDDVAPDHTEAADDDRLTLRHSFISLLICSGPRPDGAHDRRAAPAVKPVAGLGRVGRSTRIG